MEWLLENWIWVLIGIAFFVMHLGHGGRGAHRGRRGDVDSEPSGHDSGRAAPGHRNGRG